MFKYWTLGQTLFCESGFPNDVYCCSVSSAVAQCTGVAVFAIGLDRFVYNVISTANVHFPICQVLGRSSIMQSISEKLEALIAGSIGLHVQPVLVAIQLFYNVSCNKFRV